MARRGTKRGEKERLKFKALKILWLSHTICILPESCTAVIIFRLSEIKNGSKKTFTLLFLTNSRLLSHVRKHFESVYLGTIHTDKLNSTPERKKTITGQSHVISQSLNKVRRYLLSLQFKHRQVKSLHLLGLLLLVFLVPAPLSFCLQLSSSLSATPPLSDA